MISVPLPVEREDDKGSPLIKSQCANVVMHGCIGRNRREGLQCDDGKVVSFIHSEGIDNWGGTMIKVLEGLVSNKQRGCTAHKLNEMEKINSNWTLSSGV